MGPLPHQRMFCSLIGFAALCCEPALAHAPLLEDIAHTAHVTAQMIADRSVVAPGDRLSILLQLKVRPGWHTYWRNPGDSGLATQINWHLPPGAVAQPIQWPVPQLIRAGSAVNYGFEDGVGLISDIPIRPDWPVGTAFPITADVTWLVCAEICIPESHSFSLTVSTGARSVLATARQPLFASARASQPLVSPWETRISGHEGIVTLRLALPLEEAQRVVGVQFFPADWGVIDHAARQDFSVVDGGLMISVPKGDLPTPVAASGVIALTENAGSGVTRKAVSFTTAAPAAVKPDR